MDWFLAMALPLGIMAFMAPMAVGLWVSFEIIDGEEKARARRKHRLLLWVSVAAFIAVSEPLIVWASTRSSGDDSPIYERTESKECDVASLWPEDSASGRFFLGIGSLGSERYYCFYAPTRRGYEFRKVSADSCYVAETDAVAPSLWRIREAWENPYEVLRVPAGTVTRSYAL